MKTPRFEIIVHGAEHSQYFQGCGVSPSSYTHVVTGIGDNAKEAYIDCVDQVYMMHDSMLADRLHLPTKPRGIRQSDKVPHGAYEEYHYYVSLRYTIAD